MIGDSIEVNVAGGLDVQLPRMVRVRQKFAAPTVDDVAESVVTQFENPLIRDRVKPGMRIAVGCGSRGIANIAECAGAVIAQLKGLGAEPFIFPAMGSHGSASAEGQIRVLDSLGINEQTMGCPIKSSMDVVELGKLDDGTPVYCDKHAAEADAIALVCRVKAHTNFRAPIESGIVKMLVIGMGKIKGASAMHWHGFESFKDLLPAAAELIMDRKQFLFGVAMVENAAEQTALVEVVPAEQVLDREPALLSLSKELMPQLQFDEFDVLIVDQVGKNISGAGMDPNIIGSSVRFTGGQAKPLIRKIVALGLTPETDGNATGIASADVITMRLYRDFDPAKTYANVIAASMLEGGAIPMIMNTDQQAIQLAVKTVLRTLPQDVRVVHIANTLEILEIDVSENMLPLVRSYPSKFEILGEPAPMQFDAAGNLEPMPSNLA
jgi:hypothetical protein